MISSRTYSRSVEEERFRELIFGTARDVVDEDELDDLPWGTDSAAQDPQHCFDLLDLLFDDME